MSKIRVESKCALYDGMSLTFKAPCNSNAVDGLNVYYAGAVQKFTFRDALKNNLAGVDNLFITGTYVKVVLDTTNNYAYIQNSETNGYIEDRLDGIITDETKALYGLDSDAVPDDVFEIVAEYMNSQPKYVKKLITEIITTSKEWTAPQTLDGPVNVRIFGGGGSGGRNSASGARGGGGGGGHMAYGDVEVSPGTGVQVTIAEAVASGNGGVSSFGVYLSANGGNVGGTISGGNGGTGGGGGYHSSSTSNGNGGTGSYGGGGGAGYTNTYCHGGNGGTYGGGGGCGSNNCGKGGNGGTYGGGGGGGGNYNGGTGGEHGGNGGRASAGNDGTDTTGLDLEYTGTGKGGAGSTYGGGGGGGYGGNGGYGGYRGGGGGGGYGGNGGNAVSTYGGGGGGGYGSNGGNGSQYAGGGGGGYGGGHGGNAYENEEYPTSGAPGGGGGGGYGSAGIGGCGGQNGGNGGYAAGGGGCASVNTSDAPGAGGPGICILTYYAYVLQGE